MKLGFFLKNSTVFLLPLFHDKKTSNNFYSWARKKSYFSSYSNSFFENERFRFGLGWTSARVVQQADLVAKSRFFFTWKWVKLKERFRSEVTPDNVDVETRWNAATNDDLAANEQKRTDGALPENVRKRQKIKQTNKQTENPTRSPESWGFLSQKLGLFFSWNLAWDPSFRWTKKIFLKFVLTVFFFFGDNDFTEKRLSYREKRHKEKFFFLRFEWKWSPSISIQVESFNTLIRWVKKAQIRH